MDVVDSNSPKSDTRESHHTLHINKRSREASNPCAKHTMAQQMFHHPHALNLQLPRQDLVVATGQFPKMQPEYTFFQEHSAVYAIPHVVIQRLARISANANVIAGNALVKHVPGRENDLMI